MSTRDPNSSESSSSSVDCVRPLAARVQGWQPITSAPTDRTIVAYLDTERTAVVEWRVARDGSGRWWESGVGGCTPVYWLPQPPAPERNVKGEWFTEADLQRAGQDWGDDSTTTPALAARVHALIAQWRERADVGFDMARESSPTGTNEPYFEQLAMARANAFTKCADALEAALAAAPQETEVGIPLVQEVLHHPDCDATQRGFVPQDDIGKLAEEVVRQIARWVNQQPYADLESNRVEQTVYRALQIARGETFTNSPMQAALAAARQEPERLSVQDVQRNARLREQFHVLLHEWAQTPEHTAWDACELRNLADRLVAAALAPKPEKE